MGAHKRPRACRIGGRRASILARIAACLAIALLAACGSPPPGPDRFVVPPSAFQRGVAYSSWTAGEFGSPESDATLTEVVHPLGVNWISLVVTCYQETVTTTEIDCTSGGTATDADLAHAVRIARRLGIKVMLTPHIDPRDYPAHWRGDIDFGKDSAAWRRWFANYTAFISRYASLAYAMGADALVVGTELQGTTGRETEWRAIVRAVRERYKGTITYAANHGEESRVQWWDAVDVIGVDGYYPLTRRNDPTLAELRAAWRPIVTQLRDLARKWNRPVLLTEVGYQSRDGANQTPWNAREGSVDLYEQALCYQAVFDEFAGHSWFLGLFWWDIRPQRQQGGGSDGDYTPVGKPAADVLRVNYSRPP